MYVLCLEKEEGKTTAIKIAFDVQDIVTHLSELNTKGLVADLYIFTTIEELLNALEKEIKHG